MTTYTATVHFRSTEELFFTGSSDGKSAPTYKFEGSFGSGGPILDLLQEAYEEGIHRTGSVGEVRDMLFAMHRLVEQNDDLRIEVPARTAQKANQEEDAELEGLPDGAVF